MAVTNVSICNVALARAGHSRTITSLTGSDTSKEADACILLFETERNAILETFDWQFAEETIALTEDETSYNGWDYTYIVPSNCLKARYVFDGEDYEDRVDFKMAVDQTGGTGSDETKVILTDLDDAYLVYTAEITDPTLFSYMFQDALEWKLGASLAIALRGDDKKHQLCMNAYISLMRMAMASDANEKRKTPKNSTTYTNARQ